MRGRSSSIGQGLTPYPFVLAYPQDDHERLLVAHLERRGVHVHWGTRLETFEQDDEGVRATLRTSEGRATVMFTPYLCGCDGSHSVTRHVAEVGFPGGTYPQRFYVADVRCRGEFDRDLTVALGKDILSLKLPVRSTGHNRLIGLLPEGAPEEPDFEDVRGYVEGLLQVEVEHVAWFSAYKNHHRVADRFAVGRVFLLGDAAHVHSPAGGQGMNTGIGDAFNLGWKLTAVLRGRAKASLLDTYESERIAFARTLVETTDRAFSAGTRQGLGGEAVRRLLMPHLFAAATRFGPTRRAFFRVVSQLRIAYPESALSAGVAGKVHGGDRLPWTGASGVDNFEALRSRDWQLHVYGDSSPEIEAWCEARGLALHQFDGHDDGEAGLARGGRFLVRPDGYVAVAASSQEELERLFDGVCDRLGLRFG